MEPTSTASIKAVRWFLAALLAVNLYRAMAQPVTPGEAWNYDRFIAPDWTESLSRFDVNNHVLNTLLVRISTARFHLTELSMRLPSLLTGVFYLWVVFRMTRRWFGGGLPFLAVIGLLTLNPMVIDALSEARGYGMALAAWMWAFELMLESEQSFSLTKLNLSIMCLGLSVAAALAFAAPAVALLVVFLAWSWPQTKPHAVTFTLIFLLTLFVLLVIPLNHAEWKTLGVGATSLRQTINELTALSLGTSSTLVGAGARVALAVLAVAAVAATVRYWRQPDRALATLSGTALALTLLVLIAAHRWLHTPFPRQGAIYLIPMSVLSLTAVILKRKYKTAQIAFLVFSALILVRYIAVFPFGAYAMGSRFSGGRTLAKILRKHAGTAPVRVGASLEVEPIINYYRTRYRQPNWQRIERQPLTGSNDYYVLTSDDAALVEQRHLHVLYRDAGLILAR